MTHIAYLVLGVDNGKRIPPLIYCHICRKHVELPMGTIVPDSSGGTAGATSLAGRGSANPSILSSSQELEKRRGGGIRTLILWLRVCVSHKHATCMLSFKVFVSWKQDLINQDFSYSRKLPAVQTASRWGAYMQVSYHFERAFLDSDIAWISEDTLMLILLQKEVSSMN